MVTKSRPVSIKLDATFFDTVFEPNRKNLEKKLGMKVTQDKFSKMIKGFKFNLKIKKELNNVPTKKFNKK